MGVSTRGVHAAGDREVVLVGAGLAAAAGIVLLGSLFGPWYSRPGACTASVCPAVTETGWAALGTERLVPLGAAVAGTLPLTAAVSARRARPMLCVLGAIAGLGAALLVVFRVAVVPTTTAASSQARMAGLFVALVAALGVAGASVLAGIGSRLFDRAPAAAGALAIVVGASAVMVASLFMPWVRLAAPVLSARLPVASATQTVWQASSTLAVLLLFGSVALVSAAGLVAAIRWRACLFSLGAGGWIAAAIAVVGTALVMHRQAPLIRPHFVAHAWGYWVWLGATALMAIAGLATAIVP